MKHLIILNEHAGNAGELTTKIKETFEGLDYEIYKTKASRDATKHLKEYFAKEKKEQVRVYACGGDGSVFEVVNGIVGAKNAELAVYPCGTGNDFVKIYGNKERFLDFKKLIEAKTQPIDLSKLESESLKEPWYSANVINIGFDAIVGGMGNYYKDHGIPADAKPKEKNDPYTYALNHDAMKHGRFNDIIVYADGEQLNKKQLLLCTLAQGQYVGGKFHCSPKSVNNDGKIDVCILKTMTLLGLGLIIGTYTNGNHLNRKRRKIIYRRAEEIKVVAPKEIDVCVDGEMTKAKEFTVSIVPGAINFAVPE